MALRTAKKKKSATVATKKSLRVAKRGAVVHSTTAQRREPARPRTRRISLVTLDHPHSLLDDPSPDLLDFSFDPTV